MNEIVDLPAGQFPSKVEGRIPSQVESRFPSQVESQNPKQVEGQIPNQAQSPDSPGGEMVDKSDVSGIYWKDIILTRDDFDKLKERLNNPVIKVEYLQDEFDTKYGWVFPLFFGGFYMIISFREELNIPEGAISMIKFLMFILTYYFISTDKTLRKLGVNYTSQLIISICFATLLVAASSVF